MPSLSLLGKPSKRISVTNATLAHPAPDALVEKIHDAIDKALDNPEVQHQLAIADIPGKPMPLKDLASLMKGDYEKPTTVIKAPGIEPQ
jgi:tripartite-type tricarboxylate transporter receptor subunit TctC